MKKLFAFVLSVIFCLSFAACGNTRGALEDNSARTLPASSQPAASPQPRQTATPETTAPPAATPQPDNSCVPAVNEELLRLMEDVINTAAPGTAGSSLKAVYAARDLSRWMSANRPDSETITLTVAQFMKDCSDGEEAMWAFEGVSRVFLSLAEGASADGILADADVTMEDFHISPEGMTAVNCFLSEIDKYR